MVACPLCVLGLSEEEHTPENWDRLGTDPEWAAKVDAHNQQHPGVLLDDDANPRYVLRAYESPDASRLATILLAPGDDPAPEVWARMWPRHAEVTGRQRIARRITQALSLLKVAGAAHGDGPDIVVDDADLLRHIAENLSALTDADGVALPPSRWTTRPWTPEWLRGLQAELEDRP